MSKSNTNKCCDYFQSYIYLLWDGLGFFGFSDTKLNRLKGIKPRWYDRFLSKRWVAFNITSLVLVTYVLIEQLKILGNIKSQ